MRCRVRARVRVRVILGFGHAWSGLWYVFSSVLQRARAVNLALGSEPSIGQ